MRPLPRDGCPAPLNAEDISKIRDEHLLYRRALLLDAVGRIPAVTMVDSQAFEAGAVAGISLLSFLGIRYDRKKKQLVEDPAYQREDDDQTDDVKAPDVGGKFVEIDCVSEGQKILLAHFIHGVHKASAHFTWESRHELDVPTYKAAAPLISDLLDTHVYQVRTIGWSERATAHRSTVASNVGSRETMRSHISSGSPFEPRIGFSRAVRAGQFVAISGTAPIAADGSVAACGDVYGQTKRCLEIIRQSCFGCRLGHVRHHSDEGYAYRYFALGGSRPSPW